MSFSVTGRVGRKWVASGGKFAKLTVDTVEGGRSKGIDFRSFSDFAGEIGQLAEGLTVTVEFSMDREKLTDKAKQPVQVDGRDVWLTVATVRGLTSTAVPAAVEPDGDDGIPF